MTLSRGAIGNLISRYRAVLRKCRMMNVFGSLAVAGMLVAGNAGLAGAEGPIVAPNSSISKDYDTDTTVLNADQPQFSKELYAIGATGSQGKLDISMAGDAALTVDASWRRDASDSNQDQLSAAYAGNGAQLSFTGTGLFRATGQGKVIEAVAFRNGANGSSGGTMRLTGTITGEAITEASENGTGHKAIGVKAENPGTILFSGKSAWLKAIAHVGTADGVYARYGGAVDFQSEEVKILSQSDTASAASGISIEYSGGTITSSEKTALTVEVNAPASTATGISLSGASKGLVDLAGSLAVSVEGSPARGIENDQGTLKVAKASSIKGTGEGSFPSYGIWGRNGSTTALRGDVDIDMASSTTVYGVYADSSNVSLGSEGDVNIRVQGSQGRGVVARDGGNVELGSQGKEVSIDAQNTGIEVGESSTVSLNGSVKIESGTGISLSSTTVNTFPSLVTNGSVSIISAGVGIAAKYAHAAFNELHIQAGTGIDVQGSGYIGSGNTDTVLDFNGPTEIVAQNTALQIAGASGSKAANSGFVGTFKGTTSLSAINGNGVQLSGSTNSGTTAAGDCSVTFKGQTSIASEKGTGVVVNGPAGSAAEDRASVVFEGATTIDAAKAIEIKKNKGKGASVTFAYNPTPINVPARAQDADSQVNGSVAGTGTLIKSGGGSLALNGDNSGFSGEFNMQGGKAFLGSGEGYFSGATVNLTGGTLVAPELRFSGGKLSLAGGTLETGTGQIFASGLNAEGDARDPGAVKLSGNNWSFDSGLIAFDDAKYNLLYAQTAADLLGAGNAEPDDAAGADASKEITFTGTLVTLPPLNPDSFETLQKAVLDTGTDTITLGGDIVLSQRLQGKTAISRSLDIDGNGHTISGPYPGLWFKGMDSGTVSIRNITFDGLKTSSSDRYEGPVSFGPAVFFDMGYSSDNWRSTAKLIIGDGVEFRNMEAVGDGAGGAVRTAHGIVEIGNDVRFINNSGGSGGGLYSESFTTIGDNVVFEGNKGRRGGALDVVDEYTDYLKDPDYVSGARRVKYVHIGKNALFKDNGVVLLGSGGNGGAIEVQSGELSIDDGATFTGNTSKSTGGAIAVCDWSPQLPAKATLGSATFLKNSAGSHGGAVISEGDLRFNGPVSFVENTAGKIGGAIVNLNTLSLAAESTFSKNTAGSVGGGLYNEGTASLAKASFTENKATEMGGAVFNVNRLTFTDGAAFSGNSATDGGAVYNDFSVDKDGNVVNAGSIAFNGGARFTGNTASGFGGAIYTTRAVSLNPGSGQEIVFSGNTDSTGSSAIYMADGSSLNVTGEGKVVFDDTLSSENAASTLEKTGGGTLLFNASMDGFLGTASFEDGFTSVAQKWLLKNTVTVTGGKLRMPEFSFAAQDAENHITGGKLVLAGGTLETGTGQIFASGLNAEGDTRDPGAVKLNGNNWSFDSGLIAFDDAKYNLLYAQAAADLLGASNVGADDAAGSASAKEITFTGTYVNVPVPDPVPPYYYVGNGPDAASDETAGAWQDSTGASVKIADAITVRTEQGKASEYHFLSGVFDGSKTSDTSSAYACLIHGGDSGVHVTSDGPLTIQNWGTGLMPYHASVASSDGEIIFGDNVSLLNNHSAGDTTKGGGAVFSKTGITFGDNAVVSGNSTALAIGGGGYGGGALFLNGKGAVRFGRNAVVADNESYHYGGAIYSVGSVSMGDGATIRGNKTSYMGGALAVNGALDLGKGSLVEGNQAQAGGAVYSTGSVNAAGTAFRGNVATSNYGGAIYSAGGTVVLADSLMEGNQAKGGGAIILAGGATAEVTGTAFTGNTAANGGAFFIDKNGVLTAADGATGSSFTGNSATGSGGAVYAQNGTVNLGNGTKLEENRAAKGGAVYLLGGSGNSAKFDLAGAVFKRNSATASGGAVYLTSSGIVNAMIADTRFEDNSAASGGALYLAGSGTSNVAVADAAFKGNQANGGNGGAIYSAISGSSNLAVEDTTFTGNSADYGGAIFNVGQLSIADGVTFSGNTAKYGGAVYNYFNTAATGSITFNGGARFTGNTASGFGGAIYTTRAVSLNPGSGQEIVFSGNTDSTGSNAIYMADGSSLNVTGEGKVVFDDALSSENAASTLEKTGGGTLLFNASMDGFLGTASFEDGFTSVAQKWLLKNTVTVTGGKLRMPEFSFAAQDAENHITGGKLVLAGGTLETGTGQIFTNGLNAEGDNKDPGAVKLSDDSWSFDSGLIAFDDAKYNLTYAQAAADSLGAKNVGVDEGVGSTSAAKEITFIGTIYVDPTPPPVDPDPDPTPPVDPDHPVDPTPPPVDPDPDPVPPVDPDPTPPVAPDPVPPAPERDPDQDRTGTVSVDELNSSHANNIVLGNVTITTGTGSGSGKDFVVGANAKDDKTDSIAGSIGGKNIDLGSSGRDISVVGGYYLTLVGGASDTQLVTAGGNPVNVRVGDAGEGTSGVLNLGTPVMDSGGNLSGNIQIGSGSKVNVRAGTHVITGEANETTGTADVAGVNNSGGTLTIAEGAHLQSTIRQTDGQTNVSGKLTSDFVELSGGGLNVSGSVDSSSVIASKGDITVAGTLAAKVLTASSDVRISVGDQGSAGRMIAHQAQLQGGSVFLDPAWKGNDALADASHGVFTFVNNEIDGLLTAGQNSLLVFGDVSTGWALDAFGRSGLRWGQDGVTAALSIQKPQILNGTQGAVMVDGSRTGAPALAPNTATFADGSLLLVDGNGLNGAAALTSQGGTLNVDAGAKLLMDNIVQGEYTITSGFSVSNVLGWNGGNLSTPDNLIGLALSQAADGSMKVQAKAQRSSDVFRGLSLVNTMDAIWGKGLNDTESGNMGIRFLSRAASETYLSKADTVRVVDGGAQIAVAGGVQGMAVAAVDAPVRAIQDHASLSHMAATREGSVRKDGLDLWINALYGAQHARGFGAGALDGGYNADFGGIVFGGDYAFGDFRVGMALNAGSGTARSRGDFNATKNEFDFWGVNLYGSWSRDQFNIVGDLGYSGNKNEVKQDLPVTMQLGQLKADVDTGVLTAGLRGEYRFEADWADVTPHAGVRYYNLRTDGFASRIGDHDVFRVGRDTQEIWTFPIGVSLSRDFETASGWKVKPRADLSVVPAAGDLKVRTKAGVPGVAASDTVKARMMDSVSFDGTLGLEVGKDNVSFGLDYGIRASEHKTDHGVNLSFTYKF